VSFRANAKESQQGKWGEEALRALITKPYQIGYHAVADLKADTRFFGARRGEALDERTNSLSNWAEKNCFDRVIQTL